MTETLDYTTILIELDALLDTRLATIATIDEAELDTILKPNSGYHTRWIDRHWLAYQQRDRSLLAHAHLTPMGQLLKEFSYCALKQILNTPFHYLPRIRLNTYPYELSEAENIILIQSLRAITHSKADIEIVHLSYEHMNPRYIKRHVDILILYEYDRWLEIHSLNKKLKECSCPEIMMLGPAIYFKPYTEHHSHQEVFDAMMQLAAPLIGLKLLPIEYFSIVLRP